MTKKQKKVLAEELRKSLDRANQAFEESKGEGAAYCYGYLIGTVKEVIYQLEN